MSVCVLMIAFAGCDKQTQHSSVSSQNDGHSGFRSDDEGDGDTVDMSDLAAASISTSGISLFTLDLQTHVSHVSLTLQGMFRNGESMLYFEDFDVFETTMESLLYQTDSVMDEWEDNFAFVSFRNHYENTYSGPLNYQELALIRIPDPYFESVVSTDSSVRVGDTIYKYDFTEQLVYAVPVGSGTVQQHGIGPRSSHDCPNQGLRVSRCRIYTTPIHPVYQQSHWDLECIKWNESWWINSSFGAKTTIRLHHPDGSWSRHIGYQGMMTWDKWHDVIFKRHGDNYYATFEPSIGYWSNNEVWHLRSTSGNVVQIFSRCKLCQAHCVPTNERIHAWMYDYNDDLHHDTWWPSGGSTCH